MNEIKYWVGFNAIPGIGRVKFSQLENHFGNLADAWKAGAAELKAAGLESNATNAITSMRPKLSLDDEMDKLEKHGVVPLTYHDSQYPSRLKEIYDYPPVIYVKGTLTSADEWSLAVVGTRRATIYGRQVTEEFVSDLSRSKITIVSGLAKGVDTIAHHTALENGGRTIAVFASGLDIVYPAKNLDLARSIVKNGAIISEYPLGTKPRAENFPRRNRILSGLSLGVLVTEANETSGAIITANMALEQDREVFAVPGSILSPASRGTNRLIQEGAKLVRNTKDILEELNLTAVEHQIEMREALPTTDTESQLMSRLGAEPTHIDEVCRASGLPISTVSSTLAMMELKGLVRQVGVMSYVLSREARQEYRVKVE